MEIVRITPEHITSLKDGQVFVFGSNEAGKHGKGAALTAKRKFGAEEGQGFGIVSQSFAIPTKDWKIQTLPLDVISMYVKRFIAYAKVNKHLQFFVTPIGCGEAGYLPSQIAPFFYECETMENVALPKVFWSELQEQKEKLLEDTLDTLLKIEPIGEIPERWYFEEGSCPPKVGSCPMMFYSIPAGGKAYCPSCNKWIHSLAPTL